MEDNDLIMATMELRSRVKQLEEDSMEQAESQRFCVDALVRRIEKLEAEHGAWRAVEKLYEENEEGLKQLAEIEKAERNSLVFRVEQKIRSAHELGGFQARAAIREVAVWLREEGYPSSPARLEEEAKQ
jgi:hypothetical protein